jgi:hypothetical protein
LELGRDPRLEQLIPDAAEPRFALVQQIEP